MQSPEFRDVLPNIYSNLNIVDYTKLSMTCKYLYKTMPVLGRSCENTIGFKEMSSMKVLVLKCDYVYDDYLIAMKNLEVIYILANIDDFTLLQDIRFYFPKVKFIYLGNYVIYNPPFGVQYYDSAVAHFNRKINLKYILINEKKCDIFMAIKDLEKHDAKKVIYLFIHVKQYKKIVKDFILSCSNLVTFYCTNSDYISFLRKIKSKVNAIWVNDDLESYNLFRHRVIYDISCNTQS